MKYLKKSLVFCLCLVLVFSLAACGNTGNQENTKPQQTEKAADESKEKATQGKKKLGASSQ